MRKSTNQPKIWQKEFLGDRNRMREFKVGDHIYYFKNIQGLNGVTFETLPCKVLKVTAKMLKVSSGENKSLYVSKNKCELQSA